MNEATWASVSVDEDQKRWLFVQTVYKMNLLNNSFFSFALSITTVK